MERSFTHATLGRTGIPVHRLGLSASYLPGRATVHRAVDAGLNYFFGYGFDFQMVGALRKILKTGRERYVVATGPYNLIWAHTDVRRTLEKRLRQLGTDYIDVFLFLGVMKPKELPERVLEDLRQLREEGRVRPSGSRRTIGSWPAAWPQTVLSTSSWSATTPRTAARRRTSSRTSRPTTRASSRTPQPAGRRF
jgi:aryl-alcohol dehydrogenase-like predicted oxidoreductase